MKPDLLNTQADLDAALRALADADRRLAAPRHVERLVMQAWDDAGAATHARRSQPRPMQAALLGAAAVAAAVLLVAALQRSTSPIPVPRPPEAEPRRTPHTVAARVDEAEASPDVARPARRPTPPARRAVRTAAMVLVSDPLLDPSAATVVRVRMPRSALATLGIPLVEPDGGGAVDLEMIVGEDGIARTIQRAVPVSAPALQE